MDMNQIMKQAQQMQQRLSQVQAELAARTVTASVGGGMVTVTVNGKNELLSIQIDKEVINPDDQVMRSPVEEARTLAADLAELHTSVKLCSSCYIFSETDPCKICFDPSRNRDVVCVVEGPDDLIAIEKTGAYQGLYHILHGVLAPMDGIGPEEIKVNELVDRIRREKINEVLLATSSTVPGEATASFLARMLQSEKVKVTRLACGIPMGMDIKYADEVTLAKAIETRQESK